MQNRLNRDRFNVDDDDDDRLKDMDERTLLDRERWEADQRDRRRRAAEDRYRSEEDRKREEEEERRRAEEEEERRRAEEDEEAEEAARRAEDAKSKGSNKVSTLVLCVGGNGRGTQTSCGLSPQMPDAGETIADKFRPGVDLLTPINYERTRWVFFMYEADCKTNKSV